jgi:single-strand DNA-binding protein
MNSCILMAEIIKNPELRYTADNQMAIADMFVQFTPTPGNTQPSTLEVVAFGDPNKEQNLAKEMKENFKQGDSVTIEGRLEMNTIERDGYKEKRARLVASRLYHMSSSGSTTPVTTTTTAAPTSPPPKSAPASKPAAAKVEAPPPAPVFSDADADEIPF